MKRNDNHSASTNQLEPEQHKSTFIDAKLLECSFTSMADIIPDAVVIFDNILKIIYLNPSAEEMFGYDLKDVIGLKLDQIISGDVHKNQKSIINKYKKQKNSQSKIVRNRVCRGLHRDGHQFPLEVSVTKITSNNQIFFVSVLRDTSVLVAHQQLPDLSERRYRGILDSQSDLVVRVDRQGNFTYANSSYCKMFGKTLNELIGQSFTPFIHPDDLSDTLKAMKGLEYPPFRIVVEQRALTTIGWRWLLWEDSVINDETNGYYEIQGIGRDITDQKRIESVLLEEKNLAILLAEKFTLSEALPVSLKLAIKAADMDSGGIYLLDRTNGDLLLNSHLGFSDEFIPNIERVTKGSPRFQLMVEGVPFCQNKQQIIEAPNPYVISENIHCYIAIPIHYNGELIACLNIASHTKDEILDFDRQTLTNLAHQLGNMIARFLIQDELIENQRQLSSIFNSLQDFVFVLDNQGLILQVNSVVLNRLGYSRYELIGKNVLEIHPPELRETTLQIVNDMIVGLVDTCPLDLLTKEGAHISVETKVTHGWIENKPVLIGISRDITERKIAEANLLRQTELRNYLLKFEEILTRNSSKFINLPTTEMDTQINVLLSEVGAFEKIDRSYVFIIDNRTQQMSNTHEWCAPGVEPQLENLKNLPTSIFPWWMSKMEKLEVINISKVSTMPSTAQAERRILEAQFIQSVLVIPLVINQKLIGFVGFDSVVQERTWSEETIINIKRVVDIIANAIARDSVENSLRESETRNRALVSAIPDTIFRIGSDGTIIDYKTGTIELLLLHRNQIIGSKLSDIFDQELANKFINSVSVALQSSEMPTFEFEYKYNDSSLFFETRFLKSGNDEVISYIQDISKRYQFEKMKTDFINRATHELRTPIATMMLMANLIDGKLEDEEYVTYWDIMKKELNRERILVEDLLSAGRLENNTTEFSLQVVNVLEIIQSVTQSLNVYAKEKGIIINLESLGIEIDRPPLIYADENAIYQVFSNLIGNALKFTRINGLIKISLQREESRIKISVIDNGIGIPKNEIPRLFSRFFRGSNAMKNEIQGNGLGLFIVHSILEKHNGGITVRSELDQGTQFDIWIPEIKQS